MQGKIIKGIAGFYYVDDRAGTVYTCKAKGTFRKEGISPLVGDNVTFEITDADKREGNITDILERENSLIRPSCANVDQALVIFAAAKPDPNFNLLDRFLIMMQKQHIHTVICFNKIDIVRDSEIEQLRATYELCGHEVLFMSVREQEGIETVRSVLKGHTTVLAGPSGVGKSSFMNLMAPDANMETGELSKKIERGRQTTRHTELIRIGEDTYLCDTPGFTSLYVTDIGKDELRDYFVEFDSYRSGCRFDTCRHINEPDCAVKAALDKGLISRIRYSNYCMMFDELEKQEKRKY